MGCIYLIQIKTDNNKGYVGYSKYSADERFESHLWACRNKTLDPITGTRKRMKIDQAILDHGVENCILTTLFESDIIDNYDINDIFEPFFIKLYDTYGPNGYNGNCGGIHGGGVPKGYKQSMEHIENCRKVKLGRKYPQMANELNPACKSCRKSYEITFEDGHVEIIVGIKKFCRERGYNGPSIRLVMLGRQDFHKDIIKVIEL